MEAFHQFSKEAVFKDMRCHKNLLLPFLVFLFICISVLELAGIGLIGPYVSIIVSPESLEGSLGNIINYFQK